MANPAKIAATADERQTPIASAAAAAARRVGSVSPFVALGHKINGGEFEVPCSKFDRLLLFFSDGLYKVVELTDKLFVGQNLLYCALPERDRVFTVAYQTKGTTYLKRFKFGGTILNKGYHCAPAKSKILFFEPDTPEQIYIKYKPAPYQRVDQQTANPSELLVKSAKAKGNQVSIKEVASVRSKPPRNWDSESPVTKLKFV